jgi:hypothetical protein
MTSARSLDRASGEGKITVYLRCFKAVVANGSRFEMK